MPSVKTGTGPDPTRPTASSPEELVGCALRRCEAQRPRARAEKGRLQGYRVLLFFSVSLGGRGATASTERGEKRASRGQSVLLVGFCCVLGRVRGRGDSGGRYV